MGKTVVSITPIADKAADVEVVNSIAVRYKEERQESKAPTFRSHLSGYMAHLNG